MAKHNELNAPGNWVSMLEEIANQVQQPTPVSEVKEVNAVQWPSQLEAKEEKVKPAKNEVSKADQDSGEPLWNEFAKLVDEYASGEIGGKEVKMMLDPAVVETLRMIKPRGMSCLVNAILKAFIITYRTRLKKMVVAKPKSLL